MVLNQNDYRCIGYPKGRNRNRQIQDMLDNVLFVLYRANRITQMALALQEFSVTFKYRAGRANVAADCLSRLKSNYNESTTI